MPHIRLAQPADAKAISSLVSSLIGKSLIEPEGEAAQRILATLTPDAVTASIAMPDRFSAVAEVDGAVQGVVAIRDAGHVLQFFVHPAHQGQGLGSALWRFALRHAQALWGTGAFTVRSSTEAEPIYRHLGFVPTGGVEVQHGLRFIPMRKAADMHIRPFAPGDEHAICEIYNHFISHTVVTFEEVPLTPEQMRARIDTYRSTHPWLVCEATDTSGPQIVGYSYAAPYHSRAAFRHTAEVTVYVRLGCERRGIGRALYEALLPQLQAQGCHALIAAIALPNAGSAGLHESLGFTQVGQLREVGHKFRRWVDIGYWQKTLG